MAVTPPQGVAPIPVGKVGEAEITQACDGPAGPGGEVALETGPKERAALGLGQWAGASGHPLCLRGVGWDGP